MADNILNRLARNPYAPIDAASITRVDELGQGWDDWNNLIAPKFEQPEQTWGETALGVATAPARLATALAGSLSPYGADGWQVPPIAQEGWDALTAVGDAYTQGMTDDEINSRALGMAGFMMGGGGIAANRAPMLAANASKEASVPAIINYEVPDVLYHGTPDASFTKFNLDAIRARSPEKNNGFAGVSMSPSHTEASSYASLDGSAPGVLPLRSEVTNPFVWNVDDFYDGRTPKYQFGKLIGDEPATLQRVRGVIPDYKFRGGDFPADGLGLSESLAAAGYDALDIVRGGKLLERAALAPNTVRSATTGEILYSNSDSRPALLAGALGQEQKGIVAYHGSPHDFDKFDLSKIGTGEGAQAYGHGLYFAENEGVARSYRDTVGKGANTSTGSVANGWLRDAGGDYDLAIRDAIEHGRANNVGMSSVIDELRRMKAENPPGHMYQVRINADPNDFLDWDKPLSQQSEKVRNALNKAAQDEAERQMARARLEASKAEMMGLKWSEPKPVDPLSLRGADIWDRIPDDAGIPGIKYLDQMSRTYGDGSRNYVVFDDSLIEILKKYGWLLPGAMYGANALTQAQDNQF